MQAGYIYLKVMTFRRPGVSNVKYIEQFWADDFIVVVIIVCVYLPVYVCERRREKKAK